MEKNFTALGVTVRHSDYKDNDKLVTLFTKEYGSLDVAVRGCKKQSSPLLALSSNLCVGEFQIYNTGSRMCVKECKIIKNFYNLAFDIEKFGVASFILNVASKVAIQGESHNALFALCIHLLSFMEEEKITAKNALLFFCIKCSDIYGVRPSMCFCTGCGTDVDFASFSIEEGGMLCKTCSPKYKTHRINQAQVNLIAKVLGTKNRELSVIENEDDYIVNLMVRYIVKNLSLPVKSVNFLKKINIIK